MHSAHAGNTEFPCNLRYDAIKDFEPIGIIAESPMALVAMKRFPADNVKDFIAFVKTNKDRAHTGMPPRHRTCAACCSSTRSNPRQRASPTRASGRP